MCIHLQILMIILHLPIAMYILHIYIYVHVFIEIFPYFELGERFISYIDKDTIDVVQHAVCMCVHVSHAVAMSTGAYQ